MAHEKSVERSASDRWRRDMQPQASIAERHYANHEIPMSKLAKGIADRRMDTREVSEFS